MTPLTMVSRLRIVDRNTQIGEVAGALLQRRNGDTRGDRAAEAAQVLFIVEEVGLVLGSPDERQERKLDRTADEAAELVFVVLWPLIARQAAGS